MNTKQEFNEIQETNLTTKIEELGKIHKSIASAIKDSKFLSKLRNGSREIHEIKINNTNLFMRLLTVQERREAEIISRKKWGEEDELIRNSLPALSLYYEILEILKKALTIESFNGEIIQKVTESELKELLESELYQLFQQYQDIEERYNPQTEDLWLTDEKEKSVIEYLLEELEKKKVSLNTISRLELQKVCKYLISQRDTLMDKLRTLSSPEAFSNDS